MSTFEDCVLYWTWGELGKNQQSSERVYISNPKCFGYDPYKDEWVREYSIDSGTCESKEELVKKLRNIISEDLLSES